MSENERSTTEDERKGPSRPRPEKSEPGEGADDEPRPSKGQGRKSNVQRAPEDQRGKPDPKRR